jgi:hypothetical protein
LADIKDGGCALDPVGTAPLYTRELTAKDAKETTTGDLRVFVRSRALDSVVVGIGKQVFYFTVRRYKAQMTHSIRGRTYI